METAKWCNHSIIISY